jgi:hypothetical protein
MDCTYEALSPAQQQDMDFAGALDMLIAASITCLRNRDYKLKRAIEIAINYRSLSPAPLPRIPFHLRSSMNCKSGSRRVG